MPQPIYKTNADRAENIENDEAWSFAIFVADEITHGSGPTAILEALRNEAERLGLIERDTVSETERILLGYRDADTGGVHC